MALAVPLLIVAAVVVARRDPAPPPSRGAPDPRLTYCATVVERDAIRPPDPVGDPSEELRNSAGVTAGRLVLLTERMLQAAPEQARPPLRRELELYRRLVRMRDPAGFRSTELLEARGEALQAAAEYCRMREVDITALDFRYEGLPSMLGHGPAVLRMRNRGRERHEMVLFRRNPEFDDDFSDLLAEDHQQEQATLVAGFFAAPGATYQMAVDLPGGDYAAACLIESGGEPNWRKGMIAQFTVR